MQRSQRDTRRRVAAEVGCATALAAGFLLFPPKSVDAQNRPPLQEPIALEGTMKQFYRGVNVVIVTTMDGVEHVYQFTKNLVVHGGRKPGVDALEGLRDGTTVVIHYTENGPHAAAEEIDLLGDEGLKMTEGVVTDIDRGKKEITVKYLSLESAQRSRAMCSQTLTQTLKDSQPLGVRTSNASPELARS